MKSEFSIDFIQQKKDAPNGTSLKINFFNEDN